MFCGERNDNLDNVIQRYDALDRVEQDRLSCQFQKLFRNRRRHSGAGAAGRYYGRDLELPIAD